MPETLFVADSWLYFEFSLAETFHLTVGELRQRMSNAEFIEWQAFYAEKTARQEKADARRQRQTKAQRLMGRRIGRPQEG